MPDKPISSSQPNLWMVVTAIVLALVTALYFNPDFMVDLGTRLISCL